MTTSILDTALEHARAGISVIPVATDGTKRPALAWKPYTQQAASETDLRAWFDGTDYGLGIITGAVSGNLIMFEIEGAHAHLASELWQTAHDSGLGDLWQRLSLGWVERSPSGGWHWMARLDHPTPGNQKYARTAGGEVIAESRGEGGYVVAAPSGGRTHHTGKPWERTIGGPHTAPTLTMQEREAVEALLSSLNQHFPTIIDTPKPARPHNPDTDGVRPGDDYNERADWADILTGWDKIRRFSDGAIGWRREGKNDPGISATTGRNDADNLYVFSTSTLFEPEKAYSKFAAYTLLNHGGDYTKAAKALSEKGYGSRPERHEVTLRPSGNTVAELINGTTALQPAPRTDDEGEDAGGIVTQMPVRHITTLSDKGNADLFIQQRRHQFKYAPSRGKWLAWDGSRWEWQADDSLAVEAAWEVIEQIDPQDDKQIAAWKLKSLSKHSLESMAALARRDRRIRVDANTLDANPDALNTPAGIVDLTTGETRPPDPEALHTQLTRCSPKRVPTPKWDRFLATTFGEDEELIAYLQRLIGYAATGRVLHHVLPFLHGAGGNGKSVLLDTVMAILGDYATIAPADFLMRGDAQHPTELADLRGKRLVVCSEVNPGQKFDERKIKDLTGGEPIKARYMRQDYFTFQPTHTLFLMGNHQPTVASGGGESFWRRLRLLPFTRIIPAEERVAGLSQTLIDDEGPGILQWIIDGAIDAQDGLRDPDVVIAATGEYASEEDSLGQFVEEHVHIGGDESVRVDTKTLRMIYTRWCAEAGEPAMSAQTFGREIRQRFGVEQIRSNGRRYYVGMTLLDLDGLTDEEVSSHWAH